MKVPNFKFCLSLITFTLLLITSGRGQNFEHSKKQNLIPNPSFETVNTSIKKDGYGDAKFWNPIQDWKPAINSPDALSSTIRVSKIYT